MEAVAGLTASEDGRALLRATPRVVPVLRRLLGDRQDVAAAAASALVNLSADAELMDQILRAGTISLLMDALRDGGCQFKRTVVMLLVNLTQTPEGCDQVLQRSTAPGGPALGMHFRRFIQLFVQTVPPSPPRGGTASSAGGGGEGGDPYEYVGEILHNVSQLKEARAILTEPERGILPVLLAQLRSPSAIRRRGVAGVLRNICIDAGAAGGAELEYLLGPAVDVVTHLLFPLAGPDNHAPGEKDGMHPSLFAGGPLRQRERDALTRRWILEALSGLTATRPGRALLRTARAYPIVKSFHEWLEGSGREVVREGEGGHDIDMGAMDDDDDDDDEEGGALSVNDEATVAAVNRLVDQLFREDEVSHTREVTGRHDAAGSSSGASGPPVGMASGAPTATTSAAVSRGGAPDASVDDFELPVGMGPPLGRTPAAAPAVTPVPATSLAQLQARAPVPLAVAQLAAKRAAHGPDVGDDELESLCTPNLPDWEHGKWENE